LSDMVTSSAPSLTRRLPVAGICRLSPACIVPVQRTLPVLAAVARTQQGPDVESPTVYALAGARYAADVALEVVGWSVWDAVVGLLCFCEDELDPVDREEECAEVV